MTDDRDATVTAWATELADALKVPRDAVDVDALLALAGRAAHGVVRPAAPLTTFLVGYAAGQRAATEVGAELAVVDRLLAQRLPHDGGSTSVPE